ncbi:MAG: phospholipase D-like domain-containing protein [Methanomicrobiales archaeon]|nr:phospholipase D-like domain-containing protein [Methanomicrobiales archaeon]
MKWLLPFVVFSILIMPSLAFQVVEFCPDTYLTGDTDEYLILEGAGGLEGLTISDGEGGFRFPTDAQSTGVVTVAKEGRAFETVYGKPPDFEILDTSPAIENVIRGGNFLMGNSGDEILVYLNGDLIQRITWPGDVKNREGQVHFLEGETWDPRPLFIGQSRFPPLTVDNVSLMAFVSPDGSYQAFRDIIGGAQETILVNVYEFTSPSLAEILEKAQRNGAQVTVLLEGGPVGGIPAEEYCVAERLRGFGIPLFQMRTEGEFHAKYRYNHAKYIVVDDQEVLLTSENFNDNGFPAQNARGNRGWGVIVRSTELAAYFTRVFTWDISGGDVTPFPDGKGTCDTSSTAPYSPESVPIWFEGASVTVILAPDSSSQILSLLRGAEKSIDIEQAYIKNYSEGPNPFVEEAIDAARRGVTVRVLLDSYWFNVNEPQDNDEMVAYLQGIAKEEGLPLDARCADLDANNLEKIHNKGVIVDGERVLVSSINWNENSPNYNREAGLIIEHEGVGAYFLSSFNDDWDASTDTMTGQNNRARIVLAISVIIALALLYLVIHRKYQKR